MQEKMLDRLAALADRMRAQLPTSEQLGTIPSDFDVPVLYRLLHDAGEAWTSADKVAAMLEETRKPLTAALILDQLQDARLAGIKLAKTDAELVAACDSRYLHHVEAMVSARKQANLYRVRYDSARQLIDMLRTQEANHRSAAPHAT